MIISALFFSLPKSPPVLGTLTLSSSLWCWGSSYALINHYLMIILRIILPFFIKNANSCIYCRLKISETADSLALSVSPVVQGRLDGGSRHSVISSGPASHCFHGKISVMYVHSLSLRFGLATKCAVLADANFLRHL